MFSWFLKLLGIDEDRPNTSGNSYLDSSANNTTKSTTNETIATIATTATKAEEKPKPAAEAKTKSEPEPKAQEETPKEKPKPPSGKAKEAEPKSAAKSLADEFPDLKANYVKVLEDAGFTTKAAIDKASDTELLAVKGVGKASLKIMRG